MKKQLIISIGTGRCGSVSLSKFLSFQKSTTLLHEGRLKSQNIRKLIKWENDDENLFKWLDFLLKLDNSSYVGDTGMYFLPYIEKIINVYPDVKVIVMERDKIEVVESYLKKTSGRNHWYKHNGEEWDFDIKWDPCFPKYKYRNKEKALEEYWDDYYRTTSELTKKYPKNVKKWHIKSFNTIKGKNEILDFINYKLERIIDKEFKHNTKLKSQKETVLNRIKKWF